MSKATVAHVVSLGFVAEQFGTPADFSVYLQGPLDDVALRVRALAGASTYDAASSSGTDAQQLAFMRLKNAEMYLTAAELWRRIEIFERTQVVKGRGESGAETIGSRALENARQMEAQADAYLMPMGVSLTTESAGGIACGVNESGLYDAVSS